MNLVIDCLKKELERQNLLIASNERCKKHMEDNPMFKYEKPLLEEAYPKMEQFRDELVKAIRILELKRWNKP